MACHSANGFVFVSVYRDDNLCVGHKAAFKEFVILFQDNGLVINVSESLSNYPSCLNASLDDGKKAWTGQPHLIKKLEKKFGEMIVSMQSYGTLDTPGQHLSN